MWETGCCRCDRRCTGMRACGRHQCKKRCCDGNHPPCDQVLLVFIFRPTCNQATHKHHNVQPFLSIVASSLTMLAKLEQVCGRRLQCGNHTDPSPCHAGPCLPCPLTATVSCACGRTAYSLPCGSEASAKEPSCDQVSSTCRHMAAHGRSMPVRPVRAITTYARPLITGLAED